MVDVAEHVTSKRTGGLSRRRVLGSATLLATSGILVACGASGAAPTAEPAKAAVQTPVTPVTLEAWSPWATHDDLEPRLEAFHKAHQGITLIWVGGGGPGSGSYLDKVTTAVASGTPPDLTYLDNQHQGFYGKNKLLVDQGMYGKRDKDFRTEVIDAKALELFTYDGQVLGYPWMLTTGQVFFNTGLFQAAGRPTPEELYRQGKWTWDALLQAAVALTRRSGDQLAVIGFGNRIWRAFLNANGSDLFDDFRRPKKSRLDEPAAIQALEWLHDIAHKHQAAPRDGSQEAKDLGEIRAAFNQGKVAMLVTWGVPEPTASLYSQIYNQTGWAPIPKGLAGGGKIVADLTTEAQGIMKASKHVEAAWTYAKWYQKDWQKNRLETKFNPRVASRTDLYDLSKAALPAPTDLWFDMAKTGIARPVFPDWNKVNSEMINANLTPMWRGEAAPKAAAQAAAKAVNEFLASNPQ